IASVTGLLKRFLRQLPDPLLTFDLYDQFTHAAKEEIHRRDLLHASVNELPDAHYATFRVLILHLYCVMSY
ncbi:Rho GTPase activation protein, partial [Dactylonectria estremocensis]